MGPFRIFLPASLLACPDGLTGCGVKSAGLTTEILREPKQSDVQGILPLLKPLSIV
jgi:hypothetical protein